MDGMLTTLNQYGTTYLGATLWPVVWNLIKIVVLVAPHPIFTRKARDLTVTVPIIITIT